MGKKKKPFIDKKNSSTYHLVRRSRRDVGIEDDEEATGETLSQFVLMPSSTNKYLHHLEPLQDIQEDYDYGEGEVVKEEDECGTRTDVDASHEQKDVIKYGEGGKEQRYISRLRQKLKEQTPGLLDSQTETMERYTKTMDCQTGGGGVFVGPNGKAVTPRQQHGRTYSASQPGYNVGEDWLGLTEEVREVDRQFDSIALTGDCLDDDIAQALFGEWETGDAEDVAKGKNNVFEEILDDFVITASQDPPPASLPTEESEENNNIEKMKEVEGEFDYDAHIRHLMERARAHREGHGCNVDPDFARKRDEGHEWAQSDRDYFSKGRALHSQCEGEDEIDTTDNDYNNENNEVEKDVVEVVDGIVPKLSPEEERVLTQKFEAALAEYDSDDWGEGVSDNEGDLEEESKNHLGEIDDKDQYEGNVKGHGSGSTSCSRLAKHVLEVGGEQLDAILDTFLQDRNDRILLEGTGPPPKQKDGGTTISSIGAAGLHVDDDDDADNDGPPSSVVIIPEDNPPPQEDVLFDGKSYISDSRPRNPWDCETILSTYSNLDNNPVVIGRDRKGRRQKKKKSKDESQQPEGEGNDFVRITLSKKTGLPVGVLPVYSNDAYDNDDDSKLSSCVNLGTARKKGESAAEKKARKLAVKHARQEARMQKKMLKDTFKEEFRKMGTAGVAEGVGGGVDGLVGSSVFRYS